mmetsp:Transcript_25502/g.28330  ORF Transcript_25502/g.28330 Transcript_25502/m.28330 type:complete len:114 (-) Transcript_25502:82-423(-)|eukprot:CAMPEP_0205828702 /NCGR_PEP_ID=MMETSP0206-20130828/35894_1 /ASSEMBLY_ACC=CAM_ASM_000279 /TAXON_ID=36767 /ORGANISM="Euplotes focardii, Strain TN1" /LENGTH=113 /DNA_ID=CAMNT_0053130763 /DNA_START=25 /DNA_END=366 /DNA_ORIENTATION=+
MGGSEHASYGLAALTVAGGTMGFVKAKSKGSLVGGLVLGSAFVASGMLIRKGYHSEGHGLALASSLALTGIMGRRALKPKASMIHKGLVGFGAVSAVYQGVKVSEWSKWGVEE